MISLYRTGLAALALAVTSCVGPSAEASDLYGRGSLKDDVVSYVPAASPCYFRADVGYGWSGGPEATWGSPPNNQVTDITFGNDWFVEAGAGCSAANLGGRGLRGEIMFGYHGDREFEGEPPNAPPLDPMHANIQTYTLMFNAYYDLGTWGRITPYVGAGVGMAYNRVDRVYFTANPALVNSIHGDSDLSVAWSLMTGVSFKLNARAVVDVGYRYIDFGRATSERLDTGGFQNPRVYFDDLDAHEIKIGLRYHFGASNCCGPQMK